MKCDARRFVMLSGDHLRGTALGIIHRSDSTETLLAERVVQCAA
jgi:hypothetical protein